MKFLLLPWKPELVFTGTSVMGINPENMKFCSHVVRRYTLCCARNLNDVQLIVIPFFVKDYWDSIKNNDYFSLEGLLDVAKQVWWHTVFDSINFNMQNYA